MTDMQKRVWIFANGEMTDPKRLKKMIASGDCLIAADGGQHFLAELGLRPERVIGDLDSIDPGAAKNLAQAGVVLEKYPVDKNETDLELALNWALAQEFKEIRIAGALGGRLDQTLGNLLLLTRPDLSGRDVRLEDGVEEVFIIRQQGTIAGQPGDTVSLLPVSGPAEGITTQGLKYPLSHETLYPDRTRGISNVLLGTQATVTLQAGWLICIHRR